MADAWLGVDVGTSGARAVLLDGSGSVLGTGSAPMPPGRRQEGRHEQDPTVWTRAAFAATREALAQAPGRAVGAVSIDSTSGTLVVQRDDGTPVGAGVMYDDARAGTEARRCLEEGASLWERLGHRVQPTWAMPKVVHLVGAGQVPPGSRVAHQGDHVAAQLVGHRVATDVSHVLKSGYDLVEDRWPADVLERLGVSPDRLPEVVPTGSEVGVVSRTGEEASGIPAGTPVRAGMTDGCAAQVSTGALSPGQWCTSLGTTLVVKGCSTEPVRDPGGSVYCHRNPDGGWLPGGASNTGAGVLAREFGDDPDVLDRLTREAAALGVPGVVTYPLLGAGERFPFVADAARGLGLDPNLHDGEGARFAAVLHGIAYLERLAYDTLDALGAPIGDTIRLSGGATRNRWWNQLRADVLHREVLVPEHVEAAAGSAIVAAAPPGRLAATAGAMVRTGERLEPGTGRAEELAAGYHALVDELVGRGWLAAAPSPRPGVRA